METKIFDLHSDLFTERDTDAARGYEKSAKQLNAKVVYALYKGGLTLDEILSICGKAEKYGAQRFAFEDCDYLSACNNSPLDLAEKLATIKPYYASLTWNGENALASGCAADGGLKKDGLLLIKRLNALNICIDSAHSNDLTFFAEADCANRLICSHTAFSGVFKHRRNISDEKICIILQKKGIIGLTPIGHFLGEKTQEAFMKHIFHYLGKFGARGLCVGTDFFGSDACVFNDGDYGFCEIVREQLTKRGVSQKDCDSILFKNAEDFFHFNESAPQVTS